MTQTLYDFKADLFEALVHPARVWILECLRIDEKTVIQLLGELGIAATAVSE